MNIQLDEYSFPAKIVRKNNKNIYFRFKEDGVLYITCHRLIPQRDILNLVEKNKKAILRLYHNMIKTQESNLYFYYLGRPLTVVYDESLKKVSLDDDMLYTPNETKLKKWLKEECERVFTERINHCLPMFDNIPTFALRIRKMSTRWGVNNVSKRIITLNSELIKKEYELIDYVIIHELCHFYEANHSAKFWHQVSLRCPDYKEARKRLRG